MGAFDGFALVPEQGVVPTKEQLAPDTRAQIEKLAARLDLRDGAAVMGFGAAAQKEMTLLSDAALAQMLRPDMQPLTGALKTLGEQVRACSFSAPAKGLLRRIFGGAATLAEVRAQYEKAIPRIDGCADEMTDRRVALMRDCALLDRLYDRNEALYRELCSLLAVGDEALAQARARGEDAQTVERFERRLADLRLTHAASTQLAAQILAVKAADALTCDKLRAALEVTIPLWKGQMAAALGLARANDSLAMQSRANADAARGIREGARETRAQADRLARESASADRERAARTAAGLLGELEEIERTLQRQNAAGT